MVACRPLALEPGHTPIFWLLGMLGRTPTKEAEAPRNQVGRGGTRSGRPTASPHATRFLAVLPLSSRSELTEVHGRQKSRRNRSFCIVDATGGATAPIADRLKSRSRDVGSSNAPNTSHAVSTPMPSQTANPNMSHVRTSRGNLRQGGTREQLS